MKWLNYYKVNPTRSRWLLEQHIMRREARVGRTLLLPRPKATLQGFHRYNPYVGQDCHWDRNHPDGKVQSYRCYLENVIGLECEDTTGNPDTNHGKLSHWGSYPHYMQIRQDPNYVQPEIPLAVKPKRIDFKSWVKKHHPEVLNEFKEAING